jgi:hypothetical protein
VIVTVVVPEHDKVEVTELIVPAQDDTVPDTAEGIVMTILPPAYIVLSGVMVSVMSAVSHAVGLEDDAVIVIFVFSATYKLLNVVVSMKYGIPLTIALVVTINDPILAIADIGFLPV